MDRTTFEHNARGAETFRRLADPLESDYWAGYLRGIRRQYHGESFGTAEEHARWLALGEGDEVDHSRVMRGVGYRAGFAGMALDQAMGHAVLHAVQLSYGLTNRGLAERLGQTERSVELYRQGKRTLRGPALVLLRQLADPKE